jgi:hypothetical protein
MIEEGSRYIFFLMNDIIVASDVGRLVPGCLFPFLHSLAIWVGTIAFYSAIFSEG